MNAAGRSRIEEIQELLLSAARAPSRHTVESYMRRWRQWAAFAEFHDVDDLKARPDHVAAFVVARLDAGVSVATLGANLF